MKVLHIASNDVGGAGEAARMWTELLNVYGREIQSELLVLYKSTNCDCVIEYHRSYITKLYILIMEKLQKNYMHIRYPYKKDIIFSNGFFGINITALPEVKEADVIHLHWINGFVSLKTIHKLNKMGKKIIWTLHDSWPMTGGCHVGCEAYRDMCGDCPILQSNCRNDLSNKIWRYKKRLLSDTKLVFTAPSEWMKSRVNNSSLFAASRCICIPNTIDFDIFYRRDEESIKSRLGYISTEDSINVLFAATSINIPYKGYSYFVKMLCLLYVEEPEIAKKIHIHYFGGGNSSLELDEKYPSTHWGDISDRNKIAHIYSLSDVMIYPSMSDSFSLTCLECLACETPVVAFETGGVPEVVRHCESGYIAEQGNVRALMRGFLWILEHNQQNQLGIFGGNDVRRRFTSEKIAEALQKVYSQGV